MVLFLHEKFLFIKKNAFHCIFNVCVFPYVSVFVWLSVHVCEPDSWASEFKFRLLQSLMRALCIWGCVGCQWVLFVSDSVTRSHGSVLTWCVLEVKLWNSDEWACVWLAVDFPTVGFGRTGPHRNHGECSWLWPLSRKNKEKNLLQSVKTKSLCPWFPEWHARQGGCGPLDSGSQHYFWNIVRKNFTIWCWRVKLDFCEFIKSRTKKPFQLKFNAAALV